MALGSFQSEAALGAGVGDVDHAEPRFVGKELPNNLKTLLGMAPDLFGGESQWQPQYADLANSLFNKNVTGTLNTLENAQPQLNRLNSASRAGMVNDFQTLGPGIQQAWRTSNPQMAALLDQLNGVTSSELSAGSTLGPDLANTLAQSYRGAQTARGMGMGRGDAGLESYMTAKEGMNLLNNRMGNARSTLATNAGITPDIFSLLSGMPGVTPQMLAQLGAGVGASAGPKLFDPMNSYFSQAAGQNYQGRLQENISSANNAAGLMSGGSSSNSGAGVAAIAAM